MVVPEDAMVVRDPIFDNAERALMEAHSITEVVEIRDQAEAIRMLMARQKRGLEWQNRAAEIKLRAERKAGELLREVPRDRPGPKLDVMRHADAQPGYRATIGNAGIPEPTARRWQQVAAVPEDAFETYIADTVGKDELTTSGLLRLHKSAVKTERREEREARKAPDGTFGAWSVQRGDVHTLTAPAPLADIIITDPPYPADFLPLYSALSLYASKALKPGGSCLAMAGQSYLPEVIARLSEHLTYQWTLAYMTPGGQAVQLWDRHVNTFWKPVLWFVNGEYDGDWIGDVAKSEVNDNDKRFHEWGQSESGMTDIIRRFTNRGDLVVDPFCGGGTTGVASVVLGRDFLGYDIDDNALSKARSRLEALSWVGSSGPDGATRRLAGDTARGASTVQR